MTAQGRLTLANRLARSCLCRLPGFICFLTLLLHSGFLRYPRFLYDLLFFHLFFLKHPLVRCHPLFGCQSSCLLLPGLFYFPDAYPHAYHSAHHYYRASPQVDGLISRVRKMNIRNNSKRVDAISYLPGEIFLRQVIDHPPDSTEISKINNPTKADCTLCVACCQDGNPGREGYKATTTG